MWFVVIALVFGLAACGASQQDLHGIGSGDEQYKKSPCACDRPLIPQRPNV